MRAILHPALVRGQTHGDELDGAFLIPGPCGNALSIVASDGSDWKEASDALPEGLPGEPWEHVSVKAGHVKQWRTANWKEMCFVKDLFWAEDECVVQYHPPEADYVNLHHAVLHLWKPKTTPVPMPPKVCV